MKRFLTAFRTHFISGLLALAPLFLTVVVIGYLVRLTDAFVVNPIFRLIPDVGLDAASKVLAAKVAIALCVVGFVTGVGVAAERLVFRQVLAAGEGMLQSIPLFNKVYGSIREIAQAFFGDRRGVFHEVVYVEYPRKGIYALGFITQDRPWDLHEKVGRPVVTVFVPSPPNPATGNFIFAPREELIPAGISVEEGIKVVISGGAAVPPLKR